MRLELHAKQSVAFQSPATEILYGGAAGGGKSHLLRVAGIAWCHAIPGLQVYLFRRLSDDLFKNHMEGPTGFPSLLGEWIDRGYAKINYSKNFIQIGEHSKIHLCHCQYEKDVIKYQGAEIHVALFDELTHFAASQYQFLRSRVRLGGLTIPDRFSGFFPRIIGASNPGSIGHNWVRAAWVDPDPLGTMRVWRAPQGDGGMLRQYIPARLDDNPTMDAERADYESKLQGLGNPALVKAMLSGDWNIVAGGMFDDLWGDGTRGHIVAPFAIPPTWRIDRSFDWGSSKPFSVGWWGESDGNPVAVADGQHRVYPRGSLFRINEWYGWGSERKPNVGCRLSVREIAHGILDREQKAGLLGRVTDGPADPAIWAEQDKHCIAREFEQASFAEFGNRRVRWIKGAAVRGRKQGWELIRQMMKAATTYPLESPGLFVFDTCTDGFIRTVPVLPRDTRDADDVNTESEDHVGDETRYRCGNIHHDMTSRDIW